jgi:hypothetical protein
MDMESSLAVTVQGKECHTGPHVGKMADIKALAVARPSDSPQLLSIPPSQEAL